MRWRVGGADEGDEEVGAGGGVRFGLVGWKGGGRYRKTCFWPRGGRKRVAGRGRWGVGKGRLWVVLCRREGVGFRGGIAVGMIWREGELGSEVVVWFLETWALIGR